MKRNKIHTLYAFAGLCLALSACTADAPDPEARLAPVIFKIGIPTRALGEIKDAFADTDEIKVTVPNPNGGATTLTGTYKQWADGTVPGADAIYLHVPDPGTITARYGDGTNGLGWHQDFPYVDYADNLIATAIIANGIVFDGATYAVTLNFTHERALVKVNLQDEKGNGLSLPLANDYLYLTLSNGDNILDNSSTGKIAPAGATIVSATIKYNGKIHTATPAAGIALVANQTTTVTITLHGPTATISGTTITDWIPGTQGKYIPPGYTHAVYTWQDLVAALTGMTANDKIIQMADIERPDTETWTPGNTPTSGLYNGNGYTISKLDNSLFDITNRGFLVYNVHLRDFHLTNASPLADTNLGTVTLCSATGGTLTITDGAGNYGGLVGTNKSTITRSCTNVTIDIQDANAIVGGLIGRDEFGIAACATFGEITGGDISKKGNLVGNNTSGFTGYSYATATGNDVGQGYAFFSVGTLGLNSIIANPANPLDIQREVRNFNADDKMSDGTDWWGPNYINFSYEGKK